MPRAADHKPLPLPTTLPVLPLADRVLLPGLLLRLTLDADAAQQLVQQLQLGSSSSSSSSSLSRGDKRPRFSHHTPPPSPQPSSSSSSMPATQQRMVLCAFTVSDRSGDRTKLPASSAPASSVLAQSRLPEEFTVSGEGASDVEMRWHRMGCIARVLRVHRVLATDNGAGGSATYTVILQGLARARIEDVVQHNPYLLANLTPIPNPAFVKGNAVVDERIMELQSTARELLSFLKELQLPDSTLQQLGRFITDASDDPGELADMLAGTVDASREDRLRVLAAVEIEQRLAIVTEMLTIQIHSLRVSQKIHSTVEGNLSKKQREFYLRQQLDAIKEELGEKDSDGDGDSDINDLQTRLTNAQLPDEAQKAANRELKRLKRTPAASAEHQVIRTYLEWLTELPWHPNIHAEETVADIDLSHARRQLDDDHHGLEPVKRRILEHLAVLRLRRDVRGPILCLVGPPGVGKTSLGRSVARALDRRFHRIALGGVRDEAEVRGHRRTYVGAMPGLIIQGMRKCGTCDPVLLLDEIDKVGQHSMHGDPSAAMLEVLDPEQNHTFSDHYLNLPFDLSRALFIATANRTDTIPPPLLDRMEVIELSGYTADEKLAIARRHLVPKQASAHGFPPEALQLSDDALMRVIQGWTRESGVRSLEREIAALCRHAAVQRAQHGDDWSGISDDMLAEILGPERFEDEVAARTALPGLATGLAYTQSGSGGLLFVECSRMPGSGQLTLTGQLGDVIKESAHIALSWLRANAHALRLTAGPRDDLLAGYDVHVHCPAGATPKDGPSAGVTITTALYSLFSGRIAPTWLAMTGEVTLRGLVMPVGGLKEKLTAAHRAGCRRVIVPAGNKRQVVWEVPEEVRGQLDITHVSTVWEALHVVFGEDAVPEEQSQKSHFDAATRL